MLFVFFLVSSDDTNKNFAYKTALSASLLALQCLDICYQCHSRTWGLNWALPYHLMIQVVLSVSFMVADVLLLVEEMWPGYLSLDMTSIGK